MPSKVVQHSTAENMFWGITHQLRMKGTSWPVLESISKQLKRGQNYVRGLQVVTLQRFLFIISFFYNGFGHTHTVIWHFTLKVRSVIYVIYDIFPLKVRSGAQVLTVSNPKGSSFKKKRGEQGICKNLWKSQWEFSSTNTHSSKYAAFAHRSFNPTIYQYIRYQNIKQQTGQW